MVKIRLLCVEKAEILVDQSTFTLKWVGLIELESGVINYELMLERGTGSQTRMYMRSMETSGASYGI